MSLFLRVKMINRFEFRGCLKSNPNEEDFAVAVAKTENSINKEILAGQVLEACIYRCKDMLFFYIESLSETVAPDLIASELTPFMELWPEEKGLTPWAYMYPVYYQSIPKTEEDWVKERVPGKTKIGRIAFLKHDTMFEYVYWHKAIVDEGLLKGDKYQFISLHEDILFSYYEEPRTQVNISGAEGESEAIKGWLAIDPGAHFDLTKTGGSHFMNIKPLLIVEKSSVLSTLTIE